MRLRIIFIGSLGLAAAAALTLVYAFADGPAKRSGPPRKIVASFYPLAFAADQVGGRDFEVKNLTPAGSEPHDLELTPGRVAAIQAADLVVVLGHGFQPELEEAARQSPARVLALLDTPGLARAGDDPHVWLDPRRYGLLVGEIAAALDRAGAGRELAARLSALDREFGRGLEDCARRDVVTSHAAFGYLASRYGLVQVALEGLAPGAEPSPAGLERIARIVRERDVTTIYFETLVSPKLAETLARETGARTAVLDPLEGLAPRAVEAGADYFTVMRANLSALRKGLGCP